MNFLVIKDDKKKSTLFFLYINKITKKNFNIVIFFLKTYGLFMRRISSYNEHSFLKAYNLNANYLIETKVEFSVEQIFVITKFLSSFLTLIAVFHDNKILISNRFLLKNTHDQF
jgi:hypothetical protein